MPKRQYRIYFNGVFQYAFSSEKAQWEVATDAAKAMNITPKTVKFGTGTINLLTH